ncbi:hypothetical protein C8R45DRAFT_933656 [Mycena sanguinolenta]|nr:hypothetical protein C8R45DRAFT_933656 [Mycena sanguinolenta]
MVVRNQNSNLNPTHRGRRTIDVVQCEDIWDNGSDPSRTGQAHKCEYGRKHSYEFVDAHRALRAFSGEKSCVEWLRLESNGDDPQNLHSTASARVVDAHPTLPNLRRPKLKSANPQTALWGEYALWAGISTVLFIIFWHLGFLRPWRFTEASHRDVDVESLVLLLDSIVSATLSSVDLGNSLKPPIETSIIRI